MTGKPFGVIITIPPLRIKAIKCLEYNCWPWENVNCRVRKETNCKGCTFAEEVVVIRHHPPDPPKE